MLNFNLFSENPLNFLNFYALIFYYLKIQNKNFSDSKTYPDMATETPTLRSAHPGFCVFCGFLLPLGDSMKFDKTHITCGICNTRTGLENLKGVSTATGTTVFKLVDSHQKQVMDRERNDYIQPSVEDDVLKKERLAEEAGLNIIDHDCGSCGYGRAESWARQMRSADEGQSIFYKCLKCDLTEKDADA